MQNAPSENMPTVLLVITGPLSTLAVPSREEDPVPRGPCGQLPLSSSVFPGSSVLKHAPWFLSFHGQVMFQGFDHSCADSQSFTPSPPCLVPGSNASQPLRAHVCCDGLRDVCAVFPWT